MAQNPNRSLAPLGMFHCLISNWNLIVLLTKREVVSRYRGSLLGLFWSICYPLMTLAVYIFVFNMIFEARWGPGSGSNTESALLLFTGLILYSLFAECINRAPHLILSRVNYVKKVVFPLEVLPWVSLGVGLFQLGVSLAVMLVFCWLSPLSLNWTAVLFPVIVIPLALVILGASWFLASVSVFMRDIGHATSIMTGLILFLAPVFYPVSALPEAYRMILYLNPLTFVIEQAREVLILGQLPSWYGLGLYFLCSVATAWLGYVWFERTRKGFADVL